MVLPVSLCASEAGHLRDRLVDPHAYIGGYRFIGKCMNK